MSEHYYGFDLGDAESAVSLLRGAEQTQPEVLSVQDARSFISAYAQLNDGSLLIGESACYSTQAVYRSLRFKSRFLTDQQSEKDVRRFAAGVLNELRQAGHMDAGEEACVYVGCPAGWTKADRERYRRIFEDCGYPPVRIISESRAALVSACQSRHFQVSYDIMQKPVLVVDVGSSTTDFAFILGGKEVALQTAGEVYFGGGVLDELLLEACVQRSPRAKAVRQTLEDNPLWKSYCEFACRRLKEKYFSDPEYFDTAPLTKTIRLMNDPMQRLTLTMDREMADHLLNRPAARLAGRSFSGAFLESLHQVREHIGDPLPELVFLTGGVSKMSGVRDWCAQVFPEAVVITGSEPEFSVSRGLAWSGRIDQELRAFRREVQDLIDSNAVDRIVSAHIPKLYRGLVDALVKPILKEVVLPVFDRWRSGEISRLSDIDGCLETEIEQWMHTDRAQELMTKPVAEWLRPIVYEIEDLTMPICVKHNVPYRALSLSSYLSLTDVDIHIDAKEVLAVEGLTWLINTIISILVGLICGGSGMAVISSGIAGIAAGAVISLLVLFLGKDKMQELFMGMDIPRHLRRLVPRAHFEQRLERVEGEVRAGFLKNLEGEKNAEITRKLSEGISGQIETCLNRMAEVVEIPL